MKILITGALALLATPLMASPTSNCTPTGFVRDGMNLTAALINPQGNLTGDVDGTGCNIVVYYNSAGKGSQVNGASLHGANYYGIVNDGGNVNIQNSTIYDIGETPLNGNQHGIGIYFAYQSNAQGSIQNNTIWNYQKNGISVSGPLAKTNIQNNTVIGQGPVNYIAQNGIEMGYGAQGNIQQNLVVGNSYTGAGEVSSGGVLIVGGDCFDQLVPFSPPVVGVNVQQNTVVGNDVGVWFANLAADCASPVATRTNNQAQNNIIRNNAVNNTTGDGPGAAYQAGIADIGDGDTVQNNSICGIGYTPVATPPPFLFVIDLTAATNPKVQQNTTCSTATVDTPSAHVKIETHSPHPIARPSVTP